MSTKIRTIRDTDNSTYAKIDDIVDWLRESAKLCSERGAVICSSVMTDIALDISILNRAKSDDESNQNSSDCSATENL